MSTISTWINEAAKTPSSITPQRIASLLSLTGEEAEYLRNAAYAVKCDHVGRIVHFRGIIELSNICSKNCHYCGIRRENPHVERYTMPYDEVMSAAEFAFQSGYGSIVLQSGEIQSDVLTTRIEKILRDIKTMSDGKLGITLSLGEQSAETYKRWFEAGAHRYLLRIETSDPILYKQLHPQDGYHRFETRLETLKNLKALGWQTGSGILIGVPGQSFDSLAQDLFFLKNLDVDMIGMGPFIPHHQTPMHTMSDYDPAVQLHKGLNMIACARLLMPDINIASTTALQALADNGRELGILSGGNIIMPNITETKYRGSYQLYDGKPAINENAQRSRENLQRSIESIGETVGFNAWGDSQHYLKRHKT